MSASRDLLLAFLLPCLPLSAASTWDDPYTRAYMAAQVREQGPWAPPDWIDAEQAQALRGMEADGPRRGPLVHAASAFVYDLDRGEVLLSRRADERRPVASLTKVVSSLAFASFDPDLEREACIDYEQRPTRNGARSKLDTGDCAQAWDFLGAALVASDNRAAYALAASAGRSVDELVAQMNQVSADLGMGLSSWVDPSGLEDENLSTARDLARATVALASIPELQIAASAPSWDLHRDGREVRRLFSTNRLIERPDLEFVAAKTGYTDTARYCLTALVVTEGGRRLVVTLLGAEGKGTRWADLERIVDWADRNDVPDEFVADADR